MMDWRELAVKTETFSIALNDAILKLHLAASV
jgi:hypothetical protein